MIRSPQNENHTTRGFCSRGLVTFFVGVFLSRALFEYIVSLPPGRYCCLSKIRILESWTRNPVRSCKKQLAPSPVTPVKACFPPLLQESSEPSQTPAVRSATFSSKRLLWLSFLVTRVKLDSSPPALPPDVKYRLDNQVDPET